MIILYMHIHGNNVTNKDTILLLFDEIIKNTLNIVYKESFWNYLYFFSSLLANSHKEGCLIISYQFLIQSPFNQTLDQPNSSIAMSTVSKVLYRDLKNSITLKIKRDNKKKCT